MEIGRRHRFNRRIVAFALFIVLVLSYVVLTMVSADPNQAHSTEARHVRQG